MTAVYDLHSHTHLSDGTLSPEALVARAAAAGVSVLALTDHDDTAGLAPAAEAARAAGIGFVPGVEVSATWEGATIHIVGLGVRAGEPALEAGLARLRRLRDERAEAMARDLARHRIPDALAGARALAGGRIISRTHFARHLVERGFGADVRAVFKHFLRRNRPGYVRTDWATPEEAIGWIRGAGGVAVLAHPARYRLTATKLRRLLKRFAEAGGEGLEVVSSSHSADDRRNMARHARQCGLYASVGSDFHSPDNRWAQLGRLAPLPADCRGVWEAPQLHEYFSASAVAPRRRAATM